MGSAKLFLSVILLFSSWVFLGFSQLEGLLGNIGGLGGGLGGVSIQCAQKLLPCQAYLKPPSSPPSSPPDSCCLPLKQMITDDPKCLCDIFNSQELLKSFHVTQEDALKLLGECSAKVDISQCKNAAGGGAASNSTAPAASNSTTAPTSSPTTPTPTPTPAAPSNGSSDGNNTTTKSSATEMSLFGGYGFIVLFASLFISAF